MEDHNVKSYIAKDSPKMVHELECCSEEHAGMDRFSCLSVLPVSIPDTRFCSPNNCPDKIPTKRFSSPNSPLSKRELEQLKKLIEQINGTLTTLSNPRNENNLSALRVHFNKIRGIIVKVVFDCDNSKESVEGLLREAGRDFLEVEVVGQRYFIPYTRICEVQSNPCAEMESEQGSHRELIDIDPCLRREIVLNFSQVVSKDPELINIFFGIPLFLELAKFICCRITVKTLGKPEAIMGILADTAEDKLCIKVDNEIQEININEIGIVII